MNAINKLVAILGLFCLLSTVGRAQVGFNIYDYYLSRSINYDTINRFDSLHNPHGFWIVLNKDRKPKVYGYTDSQIVEEGPYDHGKKNGLWVTYYPEGSKKEEITLLNSRPNGLATTYYQNGNIKEKRIWNVGKINGELIMYSENGKLTFKGKYDDAGRCINTTRYTDGVKSTESNRVNDSTEVIIEFNKKGEVLKKTTSPILKEKANSKF